jgi:hypothetical protein
VDAEADEPDGREPERGRHEGQVRLGKEARDDDGHGEERDLTAGERPGEEHEQDQREQPDRGVPIVGVGLARQRGEHDREQDRRGQQQRVSPAPAREEEGADDGCRVDDRHDPGAR